VEVNATPAFAPTGDHKLLIARLGGEQGRWGFLVKVLEDHQSDLSASFSARSDLCTPQARAGSVKAIKQLLEMRPDLRPGGGPR
jgi:hypothetical protein